MTKSTVPDVRYNTKILQINTQNVGRFVFHDSEENFLGKWNIELSETTSDAQHLAQAAAQLRSSDIPVAFPTETVYGLGADASRSAAVLGIYKAKQRPSDNPLIVHICSLTQLRSLLLPQSASTSIPADSLNDPIPSIYHSVISRFWPGPLTIILPLPSPSPFAPSVTASLPTFGVRMPSSLLALALINLAGVPIAAPSANTSTKPSTTTAAHVFEDLSGRIEYIIDGGPSKVGIESTIVDGLTQPPVILRPGGVSIEKLKECAGWENLVVGYIDGIQDIVPRAPGMKYRHYSPKARVILVRGELTEQIVQKNLKQGTSVGILRTKHWKNGEFGENSMVREPRDPQIMSEMLGLMSFYSAEPTKTDNICETVQVQTQPVDHFQKRLGNDVRAPFIDIWTIGLGQSTTEIARGLFSAMRELDLIGVEVIFVEAINENGKDVAAAVMNRLRKAAELELVS